MNEHDDDPLAFWRGCLNALLIVTPFWIAVAAVIWRIVR